MTTQVVYPPEHDEKSQNDLQSKRHRLPLATTTGRKTSGKTLRRAASLRVPPLYRELLNLLLTVGYLRTNQVVKLLCLLAAQHQVSLPEKSLVRMVQKRLLAFWQAGLVRRIVPPIYPELRSGPPFYIYTLDKAGAVLVSEHLGIPLSELSWRPSGDESQLFLNHTLQTVDIRLMLMDACLQENIEFAFVDERLLRRDPVKVTLKGHNGERLAVSVIPDGYCQLKLPTGKSLSVCLETDMASATIAPTQWQARSFRRKVLAYRELITQEHTSDLWDARGAIVLTVTTSVNRRAHLQQVCEEAGGDHHFWFTTLDALNAATILTEPVWLVARRGEKRHSLLPGR